MFQIAGKDLKLFFADKRGMLLTFVVPIALITLFAFAFGGARGDEVPEPQELVIVDQDNTVESGILMVMIDSLEEFSVETTSADTGEMLVRQGKRSAVLFISKGYQDSINNNAKPVLELKFDAGAGAEVAILGGALYSALQGMVEYRKAELRPDVEKGPLDSATAALMQVMSEKNQKSGVAIKETPLLKEKENSVGLVHAVAGTAIMMLLFSVTAMSTVMLDEKAEGTLKKLLLSPIRPSDILFGKMISVNVISMMQLTVMFLFGWFVFGLDILPHIPSLVLMIFCTSFACSAFGVFLVSFAKSKSQASGLSTLVILTMSAIGGSMIPSFVMPAFMQKLSIFSVNYWGIQGFYDIFWRELSITDPIFLMRVLVLLGIGVLLNLIAVRLFKRNVLSLI